MEKIAEIMNVKIGGKNCEAMEGLIQELKILLKKMPNLKLWMQDYRKCTKIEHYEISGYGTALHYADRLGYTEAKTFWHKH